jgi:hypothetical protein
MIPAATDCCFIVIYKQIAHLVPSALVSEPGQPEAKVTCQFHLGLLEFLTEFPEQEPLMRRLLQTLSRHPAERETW